MSAVVVPRPYSRGGLATAEQTANDSYGQRIGQEARIVEPWTPPGDIFENLLSKQGLVCAFIVPQGSIRLLAEFGKYS